ncbi:MAG: DUF222 domain-containing protein [Myxococcales bacterium]|nr:DUF222 domain-containing protein [Myxococcales bacterium]
MGWDLGTAREHLRVARALHTLPLVSEALSAGKISYSKTRAITRVATAATEAVLLGYAQHCTASQLETVCRKVGVLGADAASRAARPHDSERYVAHTTTASGMVCVKACLRPDEAALLLQVLQQAAVDCTREPAELSAETSVVSAETRSLPTTTTRRPYNRADGLMALVQSYARGDRAERAPVELIVTVPVALLQQTASTSATDSTTATISATTDLSPTTFTDRGASLPVALTVETDLALSPQATRRLACDCGLVVATVAAATSTDATPLSIGRKTRTIPAALKRALLLRDRTCRFPGCDHRLFLEGHHLQHWADGGETSLPNLALLCSLHHSYVHERGYRITQSPIGELAFEDPQHPLRPHPPAHRHRPHHPHHSRHSHLSQIPRSTPTASPCAACGTTSTATAPSSAGSSPRWRLPASTRSPSAAPYQTTCSTRRDVRPPGASWAQLPCNGCTRRSSLRLGRAPESTSALSERH